MTEKPEDSKYNYYFTKLKKCFKPLIGIGMCAMSSMIYTVANVLVKDLSHVDLFMITCIRYYVMVMLASPVVMKRIEIEHPFPVGKRRLLIWRGIIAASYMMINYYAIQVSSISMYSILIRCTLSQCMQKGVKKVHLSCTIFFLHFPNIVIIFLHT